MNKTRVPVLTVIFTLSFSLVALAQEQSTVALSGRAIAYAKKTYMATMRDGVKLCTDVYLPPGKGPWPAVLVRTPYSLEMESQNFDFMSAVNHGYAFVLQNTRGRFLSEGENFAFFTDGWGEKQDGYDTVEWIAGQDWSDGKIGTYGGSARGITQNFMAGARPPHLVCQHIATAFCDYYRVVYQGGAFSKALIADWLGGNKFDPRNLQLFLEHSNRDSFWAERDTSQKHGTMNVPAVHFNGWFDFFIQETIDGFLGRQNNGTKGGRGKQVLLIGPWDHMMKTGDLVFPENGHNYPLGELDWLDYHLKGKNNSVPKWPPVNYYVMGACGEKDSPGNIWRSAQSWPPPSEPTPFYLQPDGKLSTKKPAAEAASKSFTYDPKNPVPTVGGANLSLPAGPKDQRIVENRPDVLVFTTEPLEEPLEVTGRLKVKLWASSSCRDTDFTAKLCDVYPDGRSMLLTDGIIRAKHRSTFTKEELLEPGKPYEFEIDLLSTSIIFNKGHRIRVDISSSNHPRFDANPNTGKNSWQETNPVAATNTIFFDDKHPSHMLLPVIKKGGF